MKKVGWLKDAVAKTDGYFDAKGKKLKGVTLSQEYCDEWNGVKKAKGKTIELKFEEAAELPVEEEIVEVEVVVEEKPKGLFSRKKKGSKK